MFYSKIIKNVKYLHISIYSIFKQNILIGKMHDNKSQEKVLCYVGGVRKKYRFS